MRLVDYPHAAAARAALALAALLCPLATATAQQQTQAPEEMVAEVRVVGNDTIPTNKIASHINTRTGRPYELSVVQRDVRQLANLGWFVDVKPLHQKTPAGHVVIYQVTERPTTRYVTFLGNEEFPDKKLKKETGLEAGGVLEPYAVDDAVQKVTSFYREKGFNDVQVSVLEGNKTTDQGIVLLIDEGTRQRVWDVEFIGNKFISDSRLKTLVKSKPPKLMVFNGYVNKDQLDADVEKLTNYYRAFGFFQAKIGRRLRYNKDGDWADVTFVIYEGPRYKVRSVRFLGNTKFEPVAMSKTAKLTAGEPFEQAKMQRDATWLMELYGSHGYVFADVKPETVFLEEPGELDIIYHIQEGEQWRVGRIIVNIAGDNPHTRRQAAINRMDLVPGEILDIRKLKASERRLAASSLFHVDAATGVRPKLTYRISEDAAMASKPSRSPDSPIRGQSPEPLGPPLLAPPSAAPRMMDVELDFPDEAHYQKWLDSQRPKQPESGATRTIYRGQSPDQSNDRPLPWWASPSRKQQPQNPYTQIRGQSPTVQQAYANLPQNAAASPYGGTAVRPTGPENKPTAAAAPTQQNSQPVQQAQFTPNLAPPAGQFGPTQGFTANPVPGYQLFPDGRFGLPGQPYPEQTVDIIFNGQETQTGRLIMGIGVNSDAGVVGNIVIDERNFDWQRPPSSWEDFRNGTAWRGAGQRFRIDASPGSEVNRYLVSFQEPYLFDTPVSLGLNGSFYDRQFIDYFEQRIGGRVSLGYQWLERDMSASVSYRGESINISDITLGVPEVTPDLEDVLGDNSLHGFTLSLVNDTRDSSFLPTEGHYIQLSGEYVTGTFDYERLEAELRQYFLIRERPDHSGRHVLSFATNVGHLGDEAPIYDRFFAGGFSTLRGFDYRGASPRAGGKFQWINSVQYLFPITADEMLHAVTFVDFGTVEPTAKIDNFRVAPGVGLRITVPALGPAPIALDFAWATNYADYDDREVFSFSLGFSR